MNDDWDGDTTYRPREDRKIRKALDKVALELVIANNIAATPRPTGGMVGTKHVHVYGSWFWNRTSGPKKYARMCKGISSPDGLLYCSGCQYAKSKKMMKRPVTHG